MQEPRVGLLKANIRDCLSQRYSSDLFVVTCWVFAPLIMKVESR